MEPGESGFAFLVTVGFVGDALVNLSKGPIMTSVELTAGRDARVVPGVKAEATLTIRKSDNMIPRYDLEKSTIFTALNHCSIG